MATENDRHDYEPHGPNEPHHTPHVIRDRETSTATAVSIALVILILAVTGIFMWGKSNNSTTPPATTPPPSQTTPPPADNGPAKVYSSEEAKAIISKRSDEVIKLIKAKDFAKLSAYVDPVKGLRFSPYPHIEEQAMADDGTIVFSAQKLKQASPTDTQKYVWGVQDGSGMPINMTLIEYWNRFVYNKDFANAKKVGYNQSVIPAGNMVDNVRGVYPKAIIVEYYIPGTEQYGEMDWAGLRLIFEKTGSTWYLVEINHAEWTI